MNRSLRELQRPGAVAPLAAILAIPMLAMLAFSVDMSYIVLVRTELQAAADAGALAHTLKGAARAIGAFGVADAASDLEALIREEGDPTQALAELGDAVAEARSAIAVILRRS